MGKRLLRCAKTQCLKSVVFSSVQRHSCEGPKTGRENGAVPLIVALVIMRSLCGHYMFVLTPFLLSVFVFQQ